ncbi:MAG: hypothetical protein NWE93_09505 [Candidatus Bathyarchaeota archaeon]|nr:hypothetical protein [Candidatus Bathyarchaeota archaeon]
MTSATPKSPRRQEYDLNVEVNQGYFKVWNTSVDSGISYKQLIACVLFVNVTNTSDKEMAITRATITETYGIIGYRIDFIDSESYIFPPNSSKLLSLSNVGGLHGLKENLAFFERSHRLEVTTRLIFKGTEGNDLGGAYCRVKMDLRQVGDGEYVWGNLTENSYLLFGIRLPIDVGINNERYP